MAYATGMTLASRILFPICSKTFLSPLRVASLLGFPEKSSTTFFGRRQIPQLFSTSTTPQPIAYATGMTLASRSLFPICIYSKTFLHPLRVASLLSFPEKSSTTFFQIHQLFSTSTTPLLSSVKCSSQSTSTLETESQALSRPNVVDILEERGLLESVTSENLRSACSDPNLAPLQVYCGFDPTAESLPLGNLLGIIVLSWFQRCGHQAVGLIGGATGRVGDPSGKSLERPELDAHTLEKNIAGIKTILVKILGSIPSSGSYYVIFNNYDWSKDMTMLDFLKNVGQFAEGWINDGEGECEEEVRIKVWYELHQVHLSVIARKGSMFRYVGVINGVTYSEDLTSSRSYSLRMDELQKGSSNCREDS